MTERESILKRSEIYISAAVIAAHAHADDPGFRQRDLRFLIDLCLNWVEPWPTCARGTVQNVQVLRFLEQLVQSGHARSNTKGSKRFYRLTRMGLLHLLSTIVERDVAYSPEEFYFAYYFIGSYRERLIALIENEGRQFPTAVRLEIEALLDRATFLAGEIRRIEERLRSVRERIHDAVSASALAVELFAKNVSLSEVAAELEHRHPYELNSQKSLRELMGGIPPVVARWELVQGNNNRAELLWAPLQSMLEGHLHALRELAKAKVSTSTSV